jgi:hypothetical protein
MFIQSTLRSQARNNYTTLPVVEPVCRVTSTGTYPYDMHRGIRLADEPKFGAIWWNSCLPATYNNFKQACVNRRKRRLLIGQPYSYIRLRANSTGSAKKVRVIALTEYFKLSQRSRAGCIGA